MYALVFLSVLASAFAAPFGPSPPHPPPPYNHQYNHQHHHHQDFSLDDFNHNHHRHHDSSWEDFVSDDVFDTARFFNNFQKDMEQLDAMIAELMKRIPTQTTSGLQGNQYTININLNDFDEQDITVKAKAGLVMVQAVHKTEGGSEKNYLDIRGLPSFVNAGSGIWTYIDGTLKVVFDVQESSTTEVSVSTSEPTQAQDREEIESQDNENTEQDADVGVRGDNEIETNEIPNGDNADAVEATSYAVDFNDEVEFVPANLKQVAQ